MSTPSQNTVDKYPLVPIVYGSGDVADTKLGCSGYGEYVVFGTERYSKNGAQYYYRHAGCLIPKTGIVYVTCESGFFSRTRGEREQLILAYDHDVNGFRVLRHVAHKQPFMSILNKFREFGSNQLAIEFAQRDAEKRQSDQLALQQLINNGADLF